MKKGFLNGPKKSKTRKRADAAGVLGEDGGINARDCRAPGDKGQIKLDHNKAKLRLKRGFLNQSFAAKNENNGSDASAKKSSNKSASAKHERSSWKKGFLCEVNGSTRKVSEDTNASKTKKEKDESNRENKINCDKSLLVLEGGGPNKNILTGASLLSDKSKFKSNKSSSNRRLISILDSPSDEKNVSTDHYDVNSNRESLIQDVSSIGTMKQTNNTILPISALNEEVFSKDDAPILKELSTKIIMPKERTQSNPTFNAGDDSVWGGAKLLPQSIESERHEFENNIKTTCNSDGAGDGDGKKRDEIKFHPRLQTDLSLLISSLERHCKRCRSGKDEYNCEHVDRFIATYIDETREIIEEREMSRQTSVISMANLAFVWDSILESIALYEKDHSIFSISNSVVTHFSAPLLFLSQALLAYAPLESITMLLEYCNDSDESTELNINNENSGLASKRRRVQMLGAVVAVKYHICESHRISINNVHNVDTNEIKKSSSSSISILLKAIDIGLPLWHQIVCGGDQHKRTVLSSSTMDAAMHLIEYGSLLFHTHAKIIGDDSIGMIDKHVLRNLPNLLWKNLDRIKDFLQVGLAWKDKSKKVSSSSTAKYGKDYGAVAVYHDWLGSIATSKKYYEHLRLFEGFNEDDAKFEVIRRITIEFSGVHMGIDQKSTCSFGGIAQTLCKQKPITDCEFKERLLTALKMAVDFVADDEEKIDATCSFVQEEEIPIMRTVCIWLSTKKKMIYKFRDEEVAGLVTNAIETCMLLLKSKSKRFLDLVLAALDELWSPLGSVPIDFQVLDKIAQQKVSGDLIPQSLRSLMKEIGSSKNEDNILDPSQKVMCIILKRFLLYRPTVLIPYFLSNIQFNICEVNALILIREEREISPDAILLIDESLLGIFETSKFLQKLMSSKKDLFSTLPMSETIPFFMEISISNNPSSLSSSAASLAVTYILERNVVRNSDELVSHFVQVLKKKKEGGAAEDQSVYQKKCLKNAKAWRAALLYHKICTDEGLSLFLSACGKLLFKGPNNTEAHELYGAILGDRQDQETINFHKCKKRIKIASETLVRLGLSELHRIENRDPSIETNKLERISPLCVIRRIPLIYFRLYQEDEDAEPLQILSTMLAKKLGLDIIEEGENTKVASITADERFLTADIIARCLPYSGDSNSLSEMYLKPSLKSLLKAMEESSTPSVNIGNVKLVIYMSCHIVQIAPDTIFIDDYAFLFSTCFKILLWDTTIDGADADIVPDLETASINLLCACVCANYSLRYQASKSTHNKSTKLIEEVGDKTKVRNDRPSKNESTKVFLSGIQKDMLGFAQGDVVRIPDPTRDNAFLTSIPGSDSSWSARVCLFNTFVLASQRCEIEKIHAFALDILPSLSSWVLAGSIDGRARHPLCVASSLQCIFTILQRTKSFSCFQSCKRSIEIIIQNLFQFCIDAIALSSTSKVDQYDASTLRVAALKLMMVIVIIDQSQSDGVEDGSSNGTTKASLGCIPPGDLIRVISTLRGINNLDQDGNVRQLAAHLLGFLEANR